jgi:hypothetical protein
VPSYQCPDDNSDFGDARAYLFAHNYAPSGTTVPNGVEILGLGPIGVSITISGPGETGQNPDPSLVIWAGQTGTGFGGLERDELDHGHQLLHAEPALHVRLEPGLPGHRRELGRPRAPTCRIETKDAVGAEVSAPA